MAVSNMVFMWALFYIAIYFFFIRRNDKGENYGFLGACLMVANSLIGFAVAGDELLIWAIFLVSVVYWIKIMGQYEVFQIGGGF